MLRFLIGAFVGAGVATVFLCLFFSAGKADWEMEEDLKNPNQQ